MTDLSFQQYYQKKLESFESFLHASFQKLPAPVETLEQSMKYSLFAGGKRIRPILMLTTIECSNKDSSFALPFACALEYIHTYSLIHDDLPCMDDDELRRGKPTNHIKFGEDIALLAGDALLTHAFCLISQSAMDDATQAETKLKIVHLLAEKAGVFGMVSGQVADIQNKIHIDREKTLSFIHSHKTGALITASIQIGALLAEVDEDTYNCLTGFGEEIGTCFQIQDDILDQIGSTEKLGKTPGSDSRNETLTFPLVYGLEESANLANTHYDRALEYLKATNLNSERLREIADFVLKRDH